MPTRGHASCLASTPHRLEALGYVLLLALLVWCVWERRVRANLKASGEPPLIDTTKMAKKNPTAKVCRHIASRSRVRLRRRAPACARYAPVGSSRVTLAPLGFLRCLAYTNAPERRSARACRCNRWSTRKLRVDERP